MQNEEFAAIVLAAGHGSRMGGDIPKQYRLLGEVPVLRRTLKKILSVTPPFDRIVIAIDAAHRVLYEQAIEGLDTSRLQHVTGGATRQQSVHAALQALKGNPPLYVVLHDAARPFVTGEQFAVIRAAMKKTKAAICALPISDTLKRTANGIVRETIDRDNVHAAQTPQGFDFKALLAAHENALSAGREDFTDDAMLMEWQGHSVYVVEGSADNFKLTTEQDFARAEKIATGQVFKSALGYDVHAFKQGAHVILGGVRVPHDRAVEAHSDGDVVLHALADAIFGLCGAGDIGTHFPPSDMAWRNASSEHFIKTAMDELQKMGGQLVHCDITLLAEAPKISACRGDIINNIARLTAVPVSSVGLKATTGEGLGFIGRSEGLAAFVMVSARF